MTQTMNKVIVLCLSKLNKENNSFRGNLTEFMIDIIKNLKFSEDAGKLA